MPESLNIESGSRTNEGLKAYKGFIDVYTMMGTEKKDLLNIPKEKEEIFLRNRSDIDRETWELGRTAFQNEQQYGAKDWYECYAKLCIIVVMKTGCHPMKTRLKLFFKWGIRFENAYTVAEQSERKVVYADRDELETEILKKFPQVAAPVPYVEEIDEVGSSKRLPRTRKK